MMEHEENIIPLVSTQCSDICLLWPSVHLSTGATVVLCTDILVITFDGLTISNVCVPKV